MKRNPENLLKSTDSTLAHKPCQRSPKDSRQTDRYLESEKSCVIFSKCFSRRREVPRSSCWSLRGMTAQEIGFSLLSGQTCHFTQRTGYWAAQNATVSLKSHLQGEQPMDRKLGGRTAMGQKRAYMCGQVIYLQKMHVRLKSCILGN